MQPQPPTTGKPMTVRGADGKAHILSDMKPKSGTTLPRRIRPIVPSVFRTPD